MTDTTDESTVRPAVTVLAHSLRPFEAWFAANAARERFVALLSPT